MEALDFKEKQFDIILKEKEDDAKEAVKVLEMINKATENELDRISKGTEIVRLQRLLAQAKHVLVETHVQSQALEQVLIDMYENMLRTCDTDMTQLHQALAAAKGAFDRANSCRQEAQ